MTNQFLVFATRWRFSSCSRRERSQASDHSKRSEYSAAPIPQKLDPFAVRRPTIITTVLTFLTLNERLVLVKMPIKGFFKVWRFCFGQIKPKLGWKLVGFEIIQLAKLTFEGFELTNLSREASLRPLDRHHGTPKIALNRTTDRGLFEMTWWFIRLKFWL